MNILDGWEKSHLKGDILRHVLSSNPFPCTITEPGVNIFQNLPRITGEKVVPIWDGEVLTTGGETFLNVNSN